MQLNSITDEREFFEQFVENGHDLLPVLYRTSVPRGNRRIDVEEFNSGARVLLIRINLLIYLHPVVSTFPLTRFFFKLARLRTAQSS